MSARIKAWMLKLRGLRVVYLIEVEHLLIWLAGPFEVRYELIKKIQSKTWKKGVERPLMI